MFISVDQQLKAIQWSGTHVYNAIDSCIKLKVYDGKLVQTFIGYKTDRWEYCIKHSNGHISSWIHEDALTDPGHCAECDNLVVNDYLCQECRLRND